MTFRCLFQDPSGRAWISSIIKGGMGTSSSSSTIHSPSCTQSPSERKACNRSLGQHAILHRIKSLDPDVFSEKKVITGNIFCSFKNQLRSEKFPLECYSFLGFEPFKINKKLRIEISYFIFSIYRFASTYAYNEWDFSGMCS